MALDLNKLNKTAKTVESMLSKGGNRPFNNFWKPKPNKNQVRVMPEWDAEGEFAGQFWREVHQHWNINEKGPVLCPKKTPGLEGECPICELIEEMRESRDPAAKAAIKDIRAKVAFMVNVQDLADKVQTSKDVAKFAESNPDKDVPFKAGDAKIQIYAAPTTVFNGIISAITDGENDVTDLLSGNNLTVTKIGTGLTTTYTVSPVIKPSAADVPEDTELPNLENVGVVLPYDKMKSLLAESESAQKLEALSSGSSAPALSTGAGETDDSYLNSNAVAGDTSTDDFEAEMRSAINS